MDYIDALEKSHFFSGIARDNIAPLVKCLHAEFKRYEKNETVVPLGSVFDKVGIILSGTAKSFNINASGKEYVVTFLEKGSYIGVLLAASQGRRSPVTVVATEELSALFFAASNISGIGPNACESHVRLLRNFLDATSEKALNLLDRIDCLLKPTIREKVMTYLTKFADESESRLLQIPHDRAALAEYLGADRSALSRELGKMKQDRLIDFYKNTFKIMQGGIVAAHSQSERTKADTTD
ncbi:MAG: Crp/Fnr family transcriptional regulator [Oscillospiraceae bacterium]|nr:Crp/Fnr family transcriptional regulator [Oscillospiraceae bacterium]